MNRKNKVAILGNGREVPNIIENLECLPEYELVAIYDDSPQHIGSVNCGCEVKAGLRNALEEEDLSFVWGIGSIDNRFLRLKLLFEMDIPIERFVTLVHPASSVSKFAVIGPGAIIQAGAVISCNVQIGANCFISPGCIIGHDTSLGPGNILAAGTTLAGKIDIGGANYFGMNASVKQYLKIGHGNILGMSACLISDLTDGETVVGVPANKIKADILPNGFCSWLSHSSSRKNMQ